MTSSLSNSTESFKDLSIGSINSQSGQETSSSEEDPGLEERVNDLTKMIASLQAALSSKMEEVKNLTNEKESGLQEIKDLNEKLMQTCGSGAF
jgi:peptidoglycan hydrolase CwlO-like protein